MPPMTPAEQTQIEQMSAEMTEMRSDVTEIKKALLGDKEYKIEGYVDKVKDIDERLKKMEERYKAGRWIGIGILISAGYGLKEAAEFFVSLLKP